MTGQHRRKLTHDQASDVLHAIASGVPQNKLAEKYNVSIFVVSALWRGETYPDVSGPRKSDNPEAWVAPRGAPWKFFMWSMTERSSDDPDECWEWPYSRSKGYGQLQVPGDKHSCPRRTHALAFKFVHGPLPLGTEVSHLCGNRPCFRPAHLAAETHEENMARTVEHGTRRRGEDAWNSVFTDSQVMQIRKWLREDKISPRKIAEMIKVSYSVICDIANENTYTNLGPLWDNEHPRPDHTVRGTDCHKARLTEQDVHEIKLCLSRKENQYEIAERFDISQAVVSRIKTGHIWKHVD